MFGLGRWLAGNGEAIFATRPWVRAEDHTTDGIPVRFTQRDAALYAILLDASPRDRVVIRSLHAGADTTVHLLGHEGALHWAPAGADLTIWLPDDIPDSPALAFRITPQPLPPHVVQGA